MIQNFALRYKKITAYILFVIFYLQTIISPLHAAINSGVIINDGYSSYSSMDYPVAKKYRSNTKHNNLLDNSKAPKAVADIPEEREKKNIAVEIENTGPVAPEAASFKAVGSDNLVNLFTGDFSYSIPLLDVGGYPVNLFYNGGITMEQEASWVGLGWNINPGTINRSVRGVPDDFNGEDLLIQSQNVKPNRTWGGEVGVDAEVLGIKGPPKVNFSLGISFNNYLGPALELGAGISVSIPITENIKTEKGAEPKVGDTSVGMQANVGVNGKLNSRSGLTFSPSLNASLPLKDKTFSIGAGISTSYNSRTGIKELSLSMSGAKSYSYEYKKNGETFTAAGQLGAGLGSSSITFARPSYIPTLRMPMEYSNYSGQLELGTGMFGLRGAAHAQGYYSESRIPDEWKVIKKPLVGFIYSENANDKKDAVMDFNRLNDGEVTPRTPILSAPQYAYDVFSIQGEGTGGSIRAYRGDLGFMRDNQTKSKDKNISIGADIAPAGHWGGNWNIISTPTIVGGWEDGHNTLKNTLAFKGKGDNTLFENVYFRNPGEATVTNPEIIDRIGGDNLVRFKLSGSDMNPRLESVLEQFNKKTIAVKPELSLGNSSKLTKREKRTQVTTMLTASEASEIGLEKKIRNYNGSFSSPDNLIQFSEALRVESFRKPHHISEINVLEQSGMRYVYGLPVYNIKQKDFTFSVQNVGDQYTGIVSFSNNEAGLNSPHVNNRAALDGYVMTQETPAYASSFLLTGLLSPDYVDVTGNGITEDDLGNAVKFDYQKSDSLHRWRTPRNNNTAATAHYNEGLRSERKDNKATISYGEREVWYLGAIESKSMIAIFKTEWREDAKGVKNELDGRINANENANRKLAKIDLYTKAEIKEKGIANARPVKTVHFDYAYTLCKGTPDNNSNAGKLTLRSVYFSYNGQPRLNKDRYIFNYGDSSLNKDNPGYAYSASDKWGTYKDASVNPASLSNADYPYTVSDNKTKNDEFAAAWSLKKILLPSGGQMEMEYEADDYAYVQNKRAADMFAIYGLGKSPAATQDNSLYGNGVFFNDLGNINTDNFYVYIKIPQPLESSTAINQAREIKEKYLDSVNQLAFKLLINMPDGAEPLTTYTHYDEWGLCTNSAQKDIIYIKMRPVDGKSPLSKTAIGFLTENLPGQAFPGYRIEADGIKAFLEMVGSFLPTLKNAFKNVDEQMRSASPPKARTIVLNKSFIRLNNGQRIKYGGGVRIKKVVVKDNWNKMTNQFNSTYGQQYEYTTTEKINGITRTISSGVASYEPGIGSEENPFREIVAFNNKMPLASAQYGAIEMPMLEGLFPAPGIGYSKVTVRSIHRKGTHQDSVVRSGIGKQVTEYYTAKDYPTFYAYTPIKNKDYHFNSFFNILYKQITDRKTVSQGFLVETNDMHGKIKMQAAYSESDENTPLSYSYHTYKNTGKNGLNDKVDFVYNDQSGQVIQGNVGIDIELMTDVREFKVESKGFNGQIQADFFTFVPWPIFGIFMLPIRTVTENRYRAVTCTKLINYHAIDDSVIVMDKGSVISTKTTAYDSETGAPVVTKTANEFKDPVYNVNYPAHWAYNGMGLAYKNIDRLFKNINFIDGRIQNGGINQNIAFESGDEIYVTKQTDNPLIAPPPIMINGSIAFSCIPTSDPTQGNVQLSISLNTPSSIPLRLFFGTVKSTTSGYKTGEGCSEFYFAPDVFCSAFLGGSAPAPYYVDLPANTTNITTSIPEGILSTYISFPNKVWKCPTNQGDFITDIYVKVGNPYSGYLTNFTLTGGGNIVLHNAPLINQPCLTNSENLTRLWVFDRNKSTTFLFPNSLKNCFFLDKEGKLFNKKNVDFKIIRSGKRNMLDQSIGGITTMINPIVADKFIINNENDSKIINANVMEFKEKWQVDNDRIYRYSETYDLVTCQTNLTEDCNGILDKKINPYVNGLLGNFKAYQSKVFYGNRKDKDPDIPTSISKNGFLEGFTPYWKFDILAGRMIPDLFTTKWVWTNSLTKNNSKGLAIETKNALGIYASSQYGFSKSIPVSTATNSRYNEMFAEGFEDQSYNDLLNEGSTNSCFMPHIDFGNLNTATIVNSFQLGFNAHSGKKVLKIDGPNLMKRVKITTGLSDDFTINFKDTITQNLHEQGGNFTPLYIPVPLTFPIQWQVNPEFPADAMNSVNLNGSCIVPDLINIPENPFNFSNLGATTYGNLEIPVGCMSGNQSYPGATTQYINISSVGNYTFTINQRHNFGSAFWVTSHPNYFYQKVIITRVSDGVIIDEVSGPTSINNLNSGALYAIGSNSKTIPINCTGIYKITYLQYQTTCFSSSGSSCIIAYISSYSCSQSLTSYKSLTTQNGCTYTKPIAGLEDMLNPGFIPESNKKMFFSAWVRETCTSPCQTSSYDNVGVNITFSNGSGLPATLTPTGPIIEGWQKIEGIFFIPEGANSMDIYLTNNSNNPIYFDDIRMHPFNANMKSYAYDPRTLRLSAEMDENNYATFYEYDEEGQLIRVKKETSQGIKTIKETRAAKQTAVTELQP